jgi:hypothetical protein
MINCRVYYPVGGDGWGHTHNNKTKIILLIQCIKNLNFIFFILMLYMAKPNFQNHPYHLVSPSPWPLLTSISLFILTTSTVLFMHSFQSFVYLVPVAIINVTYAMGL